MIERLLNTRIADVVLALFERLTGLAWNGKTWVSRHWLGDRRRGP
jgi:hypothetical protein